MGNALRGLIASAKIRSDGACDMGPLRDERNPLLEKIVDDHGGHRKG
eukprot:CAMPEP_0198362836 /NCGR_PEP_ID=MMETSP1450-20131203/147677_1 /TAXON_ID=753684 ORGANISM="Madagascaria erythrocladiodes, Strain CCMP3234" /NCGR_SAMPLE_ID=MMETSP1450 /ASSEMBLY_ACC=CAM_ASM_001115 /LENGTH=46 /DNA_ID= /DNA_START= /DNA_END= /DNA_ORIENTATION=